MMSKWKVWAALVGLVLSMIMLCGIDGCNDKPKLVGVVTGVVAEPRIPGDLWLGVAGATVSIGAHESVSDSAGCFRIEGVASGWQLITTVPPSSHILISDMEVWWDVMAGRVNELPLPIIVIPADSGPPTPPIID